jgi:hypothetical protein
MTGSPIGSKKTTVSDRTVKKPYKTGALFPLLHTYARITSSIHFMKSAFSVV